VYCVTLTSSKIPLLTVGRGMHSIKKLGFILFVDLVNLGCGTYLSFFFYFVVFFFYKFSVFWFFTNHLYSIIQEIQFFKNSFKLFIYN